MEFAISYYSWTLLIPVIVLHFHACDYVSTLCLKIRFYPFWVEYFIDYEHSYIVEMKGACDGWSRFLVFSFGGRIFYGACDFTFG